MRQLWRSALVMFLVADSVLLILSGRRWVRFTRFGPEQSTYVKIMDRFLAWPDWLLRAFGLAEGAVGQLLFTRWQTAEDQHGA